jgi:hypothetical protein
VRGNRKYLIIGAVVLVLLLAFFFGERFDLNPSRSPGMVLDSLDGVKVYYNGGVGQSHGRNLAPDGYNLGIRYQCVEFVKRYYYEHYGHKMPDSYGHAKEFFDEDVPQGQLNKARGLIQFRNEEEVPPQKGDLLVWRASWLNYYGHVAIVSAVTEDRMELVQQNAGPFGSSRKSFPIDKRKGKVKVLAKGLKGWLRMP